LGKRLGKMPTPKRRKRERKKGVAGFLGEVCAYARVQIPLNLKTVAVNRQVTRKIGGGERI